MFMHLNSGMIEYIEFINAPYAHHARGLRIRWIPSGAPNAKEEMEEYKAKS